MPRRRGQAFTKYERQAILATFEATKTAQLPQGSLSATARAHGVSVAGVYKLLNGREGKDGGNGSKGRTIPKASGAAVGNLVVGDRSGTAPPPPNDRLRRQLAAHPLAFPDTKEPEKTATTQSAPALTLLPHPQARALSTATNPNLPTQSESKTRAGSWELVGAIALASKSVLTLMHEELRNEHPDGRSLNEFASILQKLHISYGITVEKARLLHNESTGIIAKVEDLSKLPEGVTLDVAIAFVRGTIHGKLPA